MLSSSMPNGVTKGPSARYINDDKENGEGEREGKELTGRSAGKEKLGKHSCEIHVSKRSCKDWQSSRGSKEGDPNGNHNWHDKVQNPVRYPSNQVFPRSCRTGQQTREVATIDDIIQCREDRGVDVRPPFGRNEPTAVKENQPAGNSQEGQHEGACPSGDQGGEGQQDDWQLEPDGLVDDRIAEREDHEEEDILKVVGRVGVLRQVLESGRKGGLGGLERPPVTETAGDEGEHGGGGSKEG